MKITAKKLAQLCGVSRGTIDRALYNRKGVNPETREKILRMAQQKGFKPNFLGRALVTGKTMTIGVALFDLTNSFFTEIFTAIEETARQKNYIPLLALTHRAPQMERECLEFFAERKVDGIIFLPVGKEKEYEKFLANFAIPVVILSNRISSRFPCVGIDEKKAVKDALEYIHSKGYKQVIYYCPPMRHQGKVNLFAQEQRYNSYLTHEPQPLPFTDVKSLLCQTKILIKKNVKSAIFCSNDLYAVEILKLLKNEKISIPDQLGLMGFDNLNILDYTDPRISTVDFRKDVVGKKAFQMIEGIISGKKVKDIIVKHKIIKGKTI